MKERPILFSATMVRAIIEGRKTQTRRVIKWRDIADGLNLSFSGLSVQCFQSVDGPLWALVSRRGDGAWEERSSPISCPYGQPGDRLWVREAWRIGAWDEDDGSLCVDYQSGPRKEWLSIPERSDPEGEIFNCLWKQSTDDALKAGLKEGDDGKFRWEPGQSPCRWRPARFMFRWASRIDLEIIGMRIQRLQNISFDDSLAEGIADFRPMIEDECQGDESADQCARRLRWPQRQYELLWEQINGAGSWATNPWVWVVEFKRLNP